jgi:hypothetical protein
MMLRICQWLGIHAKAHFSIKVGGEEYIERYYLGKWTFWKWELGAFLHEYRNPDGDRQLHNHPWRWCMGIPLVGGYTEERLVHLCPFLGVQFVLRNIWRFRPNYIRGFDFHRIASVKPGTWTLFIHGKRLGGWGFLFEDPLSKELPQMWFEQNDPQVLEYTKGKIERADWTADEDIEFGNKVFGKKEE